MDNDSHNHIETISGEDSADIDADVDGDDEFNDGCDLQSLNESLMDLNAMKVNASPFVEDKITRNTITVRPSYISVQKKTPVATTKKVTRCQKKWHPLQKKTPLELNKFILFLFE